MREAGSCRHTKSVGDSLDVTHPELAAQLVGTDPGTVYAGSGRIVLWRCPNHTEPFPMSVSGRVKGQMCGYCSNVRVLVGFNDLTTTHPDVAARLLDPDPLTVTAGSGVTGVWSCPAHPQTYRTRIYRVADGALCPYCSRRTVLAGFNDLATTHPEISATVVDADPTMLLAGSDRIVRWRCPHHSEPFPMSVARRVKGNECGFCANVRVLAGFNDLASTHPDVAEQLVGTDPTTVTAVSMQSLDWLCPNHEAPFPMKVRDRVHGYGCGYCAGKKLLPGFNDLASQYPAIAAELLGRDPATIYAGGDSKLAWRCPVGHEYPARISARIDGGGCPYCAGFSVLPGFNDLSTTRPELADLLVSPDPATVTAGSDKTGEWSCPRHHGTYPMRISHRTSTYAQSGCPYCSGKRFLAGFNDLATTRPDLAAELLDVDPTTVQRHARTVAQWRCSECGHQWRKSIYSRGYNRSGCPKCNRGGYNVDEPGYVYLMARPGEQQVGITNNLTQRITAHTRQGWTLLDASDAMSGERAAQIELVVRRWLRTQGWTIAGTLENWSTAHLEIRTLRELFAAAGVD